MAEIIDSRIEEIRKAIAGNKQIIGTSVTLKRLKANKIEKIFITKTIAKESLSDIQHYAGILNIPVEKLDMSNEELGILCKKPFRINVFSITQ